MSYLSVYVDDRTLAILTEYGRRHDRTVEDLASAAIAEEAMRSVPPQTSQSIFEKGYDAFQSRNYNSSL